MNKSKENKMNELSLQDVKALFYNKDAIALPNHTFKRYDNGHIRFYFLINKPELKPFPSWTSIIASETPASPFLLKWMRELGEEKYKSYMENRRNYGTIMHIAFENLIKGTLPPLENIKEYIQQYCIEEEINFDPNWVEELQKDLLSFHKFLIEKDVDIIGVEVPLASFKYHAAGTIDLICKLKFKGKEVTAIVDFKSSKKGFYDDHILQLMAYKETVEEQTDLKIDYIFNFSAKNWTKEPSYDLVNQTGKIDLKILEHYVSLFHLKNKDLKPKEYKQYFGKLEYKVESTNYSIYNPIEEFQNSVEVEVLNEQD